jgi:hypothetical protein
MILCSDGHEEVCFETKNCPVCELEAEKDYIIADLDSDIKDLAATIRDLEERLQGVLDDF